MKENIEKLDSKKEYAAPQMDIMICEVQRFLCDSDPEHMGWEEE